MSPLKRNTPSAAGWLEAEGPMPHVVLSSRARFARNLAEFPFAPHARNEVLERLLDIVADAASRAEIVRDFEKVVLARIQADERAMLKESRLISPELERGAPARAVFLAPDKCASIMVNEEDHLRIQCIEPGLQVGKALARLEAIEAALSAVLAFATSSRYGFLTACPSNVGTGLRVSVMLHLPALAIIREVQGLLGGLSSRGLTVRGFNGEDSEFLGDFFQVSNEITLGKSVANIAKELETFVGLVIAKEEETRVALLRDKGPVVEDAIWRSWSILAYARRMNSKEAMTLLSRLRLGIDREIFPSLSHGALNRLFIEIQPAHLSRLGVEERLADEAGARDEARARYLRQQLQSIAKLN